MGSDRRASDQQRDWEELAQLDPEWAILSERGKRHGGWDRDEFFATGAEQIDALLEDVAPLERPAQWRTALDFGCGLGRLTRGLSAHFEDCLGLNIAPGLKSDLDLCLSSERTNPTRVFPALRRPRLRTVALSDTLVPAIAVAGGLASLETTRSGRGRAGAGRRRERPG